RSIDNPDLAEAASRREVLRVDQPQYNHNGGQLAFRPNEPYLYISLGDGGCCNDTEDGHNPEIGNGQDLATVLGKILRVDPLDPGLTNGSSDPVSLNGHYRVPLSNPFIEKSDALPEIYAYGFRNPFRFSFDEPTGRLIVGDVGQSQIEEVDLVEAGKNYGWNRKEGSFLFNPDDGSIVPDPSPDPALVDPVVEYTHQDGVSVIGGYAYHGKSVPALNDMYVFGDYASGSSGRLLYSDFQGGLIHEFYLAGTVDSFDKFIKGFGRDGEGDLYVLGDASADGVVYKIAPIAATSAILNLSTRLKVETGDNVLIGGFIISGSASEQIVLRGLGPSLVLDGVSAVETLSDPMIELHDGSGALIAANDDWTESAQAGEISALGLAPNDGSESALLAQLPPGSYTTILKGTDAGSGIGLVEIYATSISAPVNPVNISTRGLVQAGDDVMVGGFILGGTTPRKLALRAIGPSLGVSNPLPDPILELHNQDGELIAFNDNWQDTQQTEIEAAGMAPTAKLESAIVATLSPAPYTVVLRGMSNAVGVALVEAYQVDD
ncbi:MAG: PQQ-dependent sugar dehydrogenase, partial [Chthoniobacterales bacterium]